MKLGIMQPYFLPYIGYWQLMNSVDKFVVYDDVDYIKQGWINRNRIIENKSVNYITLPIEKLGSNKLINNIKIFQPEKNKEKLLQRIKLSYKKAPYYNDVENLIEKIILNNEKNLSKYIINSLRLINNFLQLNTEIIVSSEINKDTHKKGQEKVIEICKKMKADHYINPIGGTELYDKKIFEKEGIKLNFIKTADIKYKQFNNEFIPNLSIIDVMMFNSKEEIKDMLEKYTLI
jgi:hypothetical protein